MCTMSQEDENHALSRVRNSCDVTRKRAAKAGKIPTIVTSASIVGAKAAEESIRVLHHLKEPVGAFTHYYPPEYGVMHECWRKIYYWCFVISLILMLVSILYYVLAINPNLGKSGEKKKGTTPKKKYPVFYGDIAEMPLADYKKTINLAKETDFINELQAETHYNSGICLVKMKRYRVGLWLSFTSIIFSLGSWAARFMMFR